MPERQNRNPLHIFLPFPIFINRLSCHLAHLLLHFCLSPWFHNISKSFKFSSFRFFQKHLVFYEMPSSFFYVPTEHMFAVLSSHWNKDIKICQFDVLDLDLKMQFLEVLKIKPKSLGKCQN